MIFSALFALLIVIFAMTMLGRNALYFARTTKQFQQRTQPQIFLIDQLFSIVTNRASTIVDRVQVLQKSVYVLTYSVSKLRILFSAWQRAMEPVNKARGYLGI
jgi:hypothetical protein